jgi:protein-disulfide isomerase
MRCRSKRGLRGLMKSRTLSRLFPVLGFISAVALAGGIALADESGSSEVVAVVGGHKITQSQLDEHQSDNMSRARSDLMHARMSYYQAERSALEKEIDKELLTQAAAKEHLTGDQLLKREVEGKVKDPSEETLRIYYLGIPGNKDPFEAMRGKILNSIRALEEKQIAEDYIKSLRAKEPIKVTLLPPHQEVAAGDTPAIGSSEAVVTVVEFADYQCPYCRQEEPTMQRLRGEFKDKVKYTFRDFPLPMHPFARKAAEASRCAGAQGAFWPYHDKIFSASGDDLSVPALKAEARAMKLDGPKFDKCLDSGEQSAEVEKDFGQGKDLGITGTPTIYVNGYAISGAASADVLRELIQGQIDAAEEKKGAAASPSKPQANLDSKGAPKS